MFPYGYEFETPGLNMMGVSYSVIPGMKGNNLKNIVCIIGTKKKKKKLLHRQAQQASSQQYLNPLFLSIQIHSNTPHCHQQHTQQQAVRFGCTRDWRVDYVQFELTREPEFHLSVAERERAASFRMDEESGAVTPVPLPSVTTANRFNFSDGVEREPIVVFDRRQPTELLTPLQQRN